MLKIAQKLTDDDRGKYILTDVLSKFNPVRKLLLELAHDEEDDESRIVAVQVKKCASFVD